MFEEVIKRIKKFVEERKWNDYHSLDNLAKSISIEASELLEIFQWGNEDVDIEHVEEELADVMIYCIELANKLDKNIIDLINKKIDKNEIKYPVAKAKGNSKKYNEF